METKKIIIPVLCAILVFAGGYWYLQNNKRGNQEDRVNNVGMSLDSQEEKINQQTDKNTKVMSAIIHTSKGDITIEFMPENAPNTVANFVKLSGEGFYNGTKFHRVIKGFMNQGGDPLTKDDSQMARWGTGGPGYTFPDEITSNNKNVVGTVSMANAGPNTNGSQFFINVADNNFLDSKHTVFAKVIAGMDVVMEINSAKTGEADRPVEPIIIKSITLN